MGLKRRLRTAMFEQPREADDQIAPDEAQGGDQQGDQDDQAGHEQEIVGAGGGGGQAVDPVLEDARDDELQDVNDQQGGKTGRQPQAITHERRPEQLEQVPDAGPHGGGRHGDVWWRCIHEKVGAGGLFGFRLVGREFVAMNQRAILSAITNNGSKPKDKARRRGGSGRICKNGRPWPGRVVFSAGDDYDNRETRTAGETNPTRRELKWRRS
jgi:hypothetical protein